MEINRLRLNQYRSYAALDLRPGPGINAIVGDNAEGKTNSVEAVFLCAFGRSHRTSRDAELIMRGCAGGYVGAELTNNTGSHLIEIKLRDGERKKIFIDRQMASRSGELMGMLNVVMFAPEDLSIVKDGPAERRRFMDMELSQTHPAYYYSLQRYNSALKQRNALLKEPDRIGPGMLETWDEQLAALGEEIVMDRCEFIDGLSTIAYDLHKSITGGRERLEIVYEPDIDPEDPEGIYGAMLKALDRSRAEDLRRGFTTAGPHRDDIGIALSGIDVRTFGSQGQKRTASQKARHRRADDGTFPQKARRAVGRESEAEQGCRRERDGDVAGEHEDGVELREERAVHERCGAERQEQRDEPAQRLSFVRCAFRFHTAPFHLPLFYTRRPPVRTDRGSSLITAGRWRGGATDGIP